MNAKINEKNYSSERKMYFAFFMFVCSTFIYINKQRQISHRCFLKIREYAAKLMYFYMVLNGVILYNVILTCYS